MKEKKNKERLSQENEKASQNQVLQQKSHQSDKHQDSSSSKILRTILKMDNTGTQADRSKDRKLMTILKALHPRDDIDSMCQEKKREKDSSTLHQYKDSRRKE